jgi:selenide,water dikinase
LWRLKDRIDRRFMARYHDLPDMAAPEHAVSPDLTAELASDLPDDLMRCGGCGAKLAADPLRRVLARLPDQAADHVSLGIGDDAAQVSHGAGSTLLSVDGFRAMIDDPYLLGRICAHHSLNDLFAMGATPTAALALVTLPLMAEHMMEEDLFQLLSGAVDVLNAHGAPLVGGHSAEGAELSIALTVTGAPAEVTLTKAGGQVGDVLLLTKPLGTGVILAGAMRGIHVSGSVPNCLSSMNTSNGMSLSILQRHGVRALTDVTGFGLIGHLGEMLRASQCGVELRLAEIPILTGGLQLARQGVRSSIQRA